MRLHLALGVLAAVRLANAQSPVGPGALGLPALGHVAVAERNTGVASAALDLGYELVEQLEGERSFHHGAKATLGGAVALSSWASVGASLHGLYMRHPDDEHGNDSSGVGYPSVHVRVGSYDRPIRLGCEVTGWFPGENAPSLQLNASSVLVKALVSHSPEQSRWTYSANLGYAWDNSANAAPPIASLRQGDRVALGASSFDSLRAGLAAGYRNEDTLLFGEFSGDWLYAAKSAATSPMRLALGVRHFINDTVSVEARGQLGLSARQDLDANEYQPYEPRFAVFVGPRFIFGVPEATKSVAQTSPQRAVQAAKPVAPTAVIMPLAYELRGQVVNEHSEPLSQVQVFVQQGEWERKLESAVDGTFRFEGVPKGELQLRLITVDYEPRTLSVVVGGPDPVKSIPALKLEAQRLNAQVEGVVRAFDGTAVSATVVVQPGDQRLHTDADGTFRVDVPPGTYQVTISADGFEQQTHTATVQSEGVVIVNSELRKR